MSVMSIEIDRVARTCVVIECNGMGILLMSSYAVACVGYWRLYRLYPLYAYRPRRQSGRAMGLHAWRAYASPGRHTLFNGHIRGWQPHSPIIMALMRLCDCHPRMWLPPR